ncbi:hypothetical protein NPS01_03510 [Nocardioides psychrotolerans]|uniref:Lipoprotein LpqB beta-propeller domain-containing protein n=1 Tax=Nocardioides psychrotolerans TaxID=1005945 RepID=A0A1I3BE32_9ACTN|nr:hypothetical protein [Nocardioides psychrotolerans]GEP36688.1 hypothetical protein NPS01_03510 [Nocardioides psychrotolerans]SFH60567.1 hypothetical protein SAMN05216561_10189 [Nocardioides psychrotolerans]
MTHHAPDVVRRAVAAVALLTLGAGCGTASDPSPPSGVDELTVPTPSPDPADYVDGIDNPWLPLTPGSSWAYAVTGGAGGGVVVTVADDPVTIAGVSAIAVQTVATFTAPEPGEVNVEGWSTTPRTDYYAQDTRGNVWWLGREGRWQVGEDGAEAGIAMLATPRVGDGYREALVPGSEGPTAEVAALDGTADTVLGELEDMVVIDVSTPDGLVQRGFYARGAGLVHRETLTGASEETLELSATTIEADD